MTLEKVTVVDRIEVVENGHVQVRTKTAILENGKEISSKFHRHIIVPGDNYSAEDSRVRSVCAAVHTANVIAAYQGSQVKAEE